MNLDNVDFHYIGGERYYSEGDVKQLFERNETETYIRIVELFDFDDDEFSRLIEFFNTCERYDDILIYIDSGGGKTNIKEKLHVLLDNYPNVTLVAGGELGSSAFHFFIEADCNKIVTDKVLACFHRHTIGININEEGNPKAEFENYIHKRKEFYKQYTESFMERCGFTKEEMDIVRQDKDLYITPDRLQKMMDRYDESRR